MGIYIYVCRGSFFFGDSDVGRRQYHIFDCTVIYCYIVCIDVERPCSMYFLLKELRGGSRGDKEESCRGRGSGASPLGDLRYYVEQRIYRCYFVFYRRELRCQ